MEIFILVLPARNAVNLLIRMECTVLQLHFKTLAPGYRVGWIAPGKYKDKIMKLKLLHSTSSISIVNEAVANFLKSGKYEKHLHSFAKPFRAITRTMYKPLQSLSPGTKTAARRTFYMDRI
jgi:DNA-binding transcriptional MocR family regulator